MDVSTIPAIASAAEARVAEPSDARAAVAADDRAAQVAAARGTPKPDPPPPQAPEPDLKFTLTNADAQARFVLDSASNRVTVTIYHRETGEVIREIPPKRIRDILAAITGRGVLVDEQG